MIQGALALEFKSATLYALRLLLRTHDINILTQSLAQYLADNPGFFDHEPVVVDATQVEQSIDWQSLVKLLRDHRLEAIGIVAPANMLEAARLAGLTPVTLSGSTSPHSKALASPTLNEPQDSSALIITKPLRSGQRIYARHTDLVVIGMVSPGAEVIADGNVHVYGPLRGKAVAGAQGNLAARIFTTQLDAELLSIAGVFKVIENKLDSTLHNQAAMIRLEDESLHIETIKS